jgi:zinc/manganese transport system substrate-binding protein
MQKRTQIVMAVAVAAALIGVGTAEILTSGAAPACAGVALGLPPQNNTTAAAPAHEGSPAASTDGESGIEQAVLAGTSFGGALPHPATPSDPIQVVAAENFWGSLVSQLGGNLTHVISIITDPNTDPHEYESNTTDSRDITNANYVIVNGVGYDDWAIDEVLADGETNQTVLNVGTLNGVSVTGGIVTGNPHMWYNPVYVNNTVAAMYADLVRIAPANTTYFQAQYATLNESLAKLYHQAYEIKLFHAGAVVASTESIFVYLANYTDLDLVSPPAFMEAIAEGNDPPAQSVVTFECQLKSGRVSMLVYNEQTVTPLTTTMQSTAISNGVAVVGVTETIQPPTWTFQAWMTNQYAYLENGLNETALGS